MNKKVSILGIDYSIVYCEQHEDKALQNNDGYCDTSIKTIVVDTQKSLEGEIGVKKDLAGHVKKVLRHEITHAFLSESGLNQESWAKDEEIVDWIAWQFPKLLEAFKEVDAI